MFWDLSLPEYYRPNLSQHTNHGLRRSTYDKDTTDKATNVELELTRLGIVEVVSNETMNLGS